MPGPPPKPNILQIARGDPGKRAKARAKTEPKPTGAPEPPPELSKEARAIWGRHAESVQELGLLTNLDAEAFGMYCEATAEFWKFQAKAAKKPTLRLKTKTGQTYEQVSPYTTLRDNAEKRANRLADRFGLSPAARSRISVKPPAKADVLDDLDNETG
jgi:P27 family predicted phage terminase small subunit